MFLPNRHSCTAFPLTNPCDWKGAHFTKVFVVIKHVHKIEMKTNKWNHHLAIIKPQIASTIKKGHLPLPNDSLTKTTYISVKKSANIFQRWWWEMVMNPISSKSTKKSKMTTSRSHTTNNLMCWLMWLPARRTCKICSNFWGCFCWQAKLEQNPFAKWIEDPCIHYSWQSKGTPTMPPSN